MTVEEARQKCSSFRPQRKGNKISCAFLDGELCTLPDQFLCILKKREELKKRMTITYSSLSSFHFCPRSYFFAYIKKIQPKEISLPILTGLWGHYRLADIYRKEQENDDHRRPSQPLSDTTSVFLDELLNQYSKLYAEEIANYQKQSEVCVEREFSIPFGQNYELAGIYDLYDKPSKTICDHKFKRELTTEKIEVENQASTYFLAIPQAERFCINMLCTSLKIRKNEGIKNYRKRINDLAESKPGLFFQRVYFYRSEFDLKRFMKKIEYTVERILSANFRLENNFSFHCRFCPFISICRTGSIGNEFEKRRGEFGGDKIYIGG